MNEQHEIMSDWYEDINAEAEAEAVGIDGYEAPEAAEATRLAPESKPWNEAELIDFATQAFGDE